GHPVEILAARRRPPPVARAGRLDPQGRGAGDPVEEGAEAPWAAGVEPVQGAAGLEAVGEHLLDGVVDVLAVGRGPPPGRQVGADDRLVPAGEPVAVVAVARRRAADDGPAGSVVTGHEPKSGLPPRRRRRCPSGPVAGRTGVPPWFDRTPRQGNLRAA